MSERDQFLAAIRANPSDYALRYVFADWLDEHDEPEEADRQRHYEAAEKWLMDFANEFELTYPKLLDAAASHIETGQLHRLSFDTPERAFNDWEMRKFWSHYRTVSGRVTDPELGNFFRCSC